MKIAINGIYLNFNRKNDGIGRYSYALINEFRNYKHLKFYILVDRLFKFKGIRENFSSPNIVPVFIPFPTFRIYLLKFWNSFIVPFVLKLFRIDLYFAPDGIASYKGAKKYVSTIHDLAFIRFPENVLPKFGEMYSVEYKKTALSADMIVTVSNYSKKDIIRNFNLPENKVEVIYNGVENSFKNDFTENINSEVLKKFSIDTEYIFYFGTIEPRKNLISLLKAFEIIREKRKLKFVITGKKGWLYSSFEEELNKSKYRNDIILTGYLNDKNLKQLLLAASVFVYVPLFEGFGLPVAEAMAMGKWIVTSNTSSIPEIIDDQTIAVNPNNIKEISKAIETQLERNKNEKINKEAVKKAEEFTWQKSAEKHIQIFEKLLSEK